MAQVINTNIASLNAQRNLNESQSSLNTSLERLSTGLRINSAKDDAAGLAIAERFTTQIRGLEQAQRNANDGISFSQTAEGALGTVGDALQRIRELAVQSGNDTNSSDDRRALNNEVSQLLAEVQRVSSTTQFNGQNILDGSLQELFFQVGANQGQTIEVAGVDARSSNLGANTYNGQAIAQGDISGVSGFTLNGTDVELSGLDSSAGVVEAINKVSSDSGVTAQLTPETEVEFTYLADDTNDRTLNLNGVNIDIDINTSAKDAAAAINAVSNQTGVKAAINEDATGNIVLTETNGGVIELTEDGSSAVFATAASGGDAISGVGSGESEDYDAGIVLVTDLDKTITTAGTNVENLGLEIGALTLDDDVLTNVNVLTREDASDALLTLDFALQQVNGLRAEFGAVQTRFESTIDNLSITSENLSAARSRIQDADFASETASLTRAQILQQAGTSVLAQANQIPQNVLSLLG